MSCLGKGLQNHMRTLRIPLEIMQEARGLSKRATRELKDFFRNPEHAEKERAKKHEEEDDMWRKRNNWESEGEDRELKHLKFVFPSFTKGLRVKMLEIGYRTARSTLTCTASTPIRGLS